MVHRYAGIFIFFKKPHLIFLFCIAAHNCFSVKNTLKNSCRIIDNSDLISYLSDISDYFQYQGQTTEKQLLTVKYPLSALTLFTHPQSSLFF